ncbi:hypothetical protein RYX36_006499 [Vicia faba]
MENFTWIDDMAKMLRIKCEFYLKLRFSKNCTSTGVLVSLSAHYDVVLRFGLSGEQYVWDKHEDRLGLIGLGFSVVVAFWALTNLIMAIEKLTVISILLELIGILISTWFTYGYLLFKLDRKELFQILNKSSLYIMGQ